MNYLIEQQSQLKELEPLFSSLSIESGTVSVDTEFFREKTYSAKLCLVQLGIGDDQYCIDVLQIEDLTLLRDLFSNPNVLKLFHAARQDMEVIYQNFGVLPQPIFDTQLAAAFCGSDMQIGYGNLVLERLDIDLPKTQSRTDWSKRPLTPEQFEYAGDDVAHLYALYQQALEDLTSANKLDWYQQEIETYYDVGLYVIEPEKAYRRLSGGGLKISQQYVLKAMAQWREEVAQKRDIPRTWVLRDDKLFDLAVTRPKTEQAVKDMNVFTKKTAKYYSADIAKLIANTKSGEERVWRKFEPLTKVEKSFCSTLMKEVAEISKQHKVAQALLGTRKDIESLYRNRSSKKLLKGWRENIVGNVLIDLIRQERII